VLVGSKFVLDQELNLRTFLIIEIQRLEDISGMARGFLKKKRE
jgi:hypothetical protein